MRIAIIGSGIAGLGAAWLLHKQHDVTVYEKNAYAGGHTNTVMDGAQPIDTGFIVYNRKNYPRLIAMFDELGIATQASNMSFSASLNNGKIEWATNSLNSIFAQRRRLLSARHYRMILDILRFHRQGKVLLAQDIDSSMSMDSFIRLHHYSQSFRDHYLVPMAASIWSTPAIQIGDYPIASLLRFFNNHGLLDTAEQPTWRTVTGGSRTYVERICALLGPGRIRLNRPVRSIRRANVSVAVKDDYGSEHFDHVIMAAHADQSLAMLGKDASASETELLHVFKFKSNRAVLHSDERLMPKLRSVWSAWNYLCGGQNSHDGVSLTYWMNRLQAIPVERQYFVTLNPRLEPDSKKIICEIEYEHPIFDARAINAQHNLASIQGINRTWFCGAWCGYGFHEDGLAAAEKVAHALGVTPWPTDKQA